MNTAEKTIYLLLACDLQKSSRFLNKYPCSFPENKSFPPSFIRQSRKVFQKNRKALGKLKGKAEAHKGPAEELLAEELLGPWKGFCQKSPYEEALIVVLCGILKCPLEKATWLLKTAPETLSYRFHQGLLALAKELTEGLAHGSAEGSAHDLAHGSAEGLAHGSAEGSAHGSAHDPAEGLAHGSAEGSAHDPVRQVLKNMQEPALESNMSFFEDQQALSQALKYCQWLRGRGWPVLHKAKTGKIKKYVFFLTLFTAVLILLVLLIHLLTPSRVILYQHFYDKIFKGSPLSKEL